MRSRCASSSLLCALELGEPLLQLGLDAGDRLPQPLLVGDVVRRREQREAIELLDDLARERIDRCRCARPRRRRAGCGPPAPRTRGTPRSCRRARGTCCGRTRSRCARTAARRAGAGSSRWSLLVADVQHQQLLGVLLGRTEAVDRRHRRDDDHVAAGEQRARGRVAQPVDLVVDRAVLLDVRVGRREVRLGLVVVVVADEVLDPVLREQLPELGRELRGQRLVGREHQRRPLRLRDHVGDREALARAGDAEQRLEPVAVGRARRPSASIASGWSPAGARSVTSSNSGTSVDAYRRV